jgi:hypothetical protein
MLRWLQTPGLGFPEQGYELERAPIPDPSTLEWWLYPGIEGAATFDFHGGAVTLESDLPMTFPDVGGAPMLAVTTGQTVTVTFNGPAWWTIVRVQTGGGPLTVEGLARGAVKIDATREGTIEWRTRGLEALRITGNGIVERIQYQPLDTHRAWVHVAHRCLPVIDPRYRCAQLGAASNEQIAHSRVPPGVDWAGRYAPGYGDLDEALIALATGTPLPFAGLVPATQSSTTEPPRGDVDPAGIVELAMIQDAHIARVVGTLYDDNVPLDGLAWAYRVTGTWDGPARRIPITTAGLSTAGVVVTVDDHPYQPVPGGGAIAVGETLTIDAAAARTPLHRLDMDIAAAAGTRWELVDTTGAAHRGTWPGGRDITRRRLASNEPIATITVTSRRPFTVSGLWRPGATVTRSSILPYVTAGPAPAPPAPQALTVTVDAPPGSPARAALRWDITGAADPFSGGVHTHQLAATQISTDPTSPAPAAPAFEERMLLDSQPRLVSKQAAAAGDPLAYEWALSEGWRAWWVRGVDLFGRVSDPSRPVVAAVADPSAPPAPVIVAAEYVQVGLDPYTAASLGRSAAGDAWANAQPAVGAQSAIIVTFAWTPDLDARCADVDAFRVYARTPNPDGSWTGRLWATPIAYLGPFPVRFDATFTAESDHLAEVTVDTVDVLKADIRPFSPGLGNEGEDDTHARCATDVAVDLDGALVHTELVDAAGIAHKVTSHGTGDRAILVVEHPAGNPPVAGSATLRAGGTGLRRVTTTITVPPLSSNPHRRRITGVLVAPLDRRRDVRGALV